MKIKVLLTALLTLTSTIAATYGYASSWSAVEGGQVVDGKYQLTCDEGTGWQKCGKEEKSCLYDLTLNEKGVLNNVFILVGQSAPSDNTYTNARYYPGNFKSLPYVIDPLVMVMSNGKNITQSKTGYLPRITINKMRSISDNMKFYRGFDGYTPSVESDFRNVFGNEFLDLSEIKSVDSNGKVFYPGKLREITLLGSGYELATWYVHEVCIED